MRLVACPVEAAVLGRVRARTLGLKNGMQVSAIQGNVKIFDWRHRAVQVSQIEDLLMGMTALRCTKLGNFPNQVGWRDDVSSGMKVLSHRILPAGKSDDFRWPWAKFISQCIS